MQENEKPFGCMAEGCNMRFTNEDRLTVHKKKHDMILNLGNGQKLNVFVADQTPTPTRFIRNCEEVGLFQDLQNVNPFEETFQKAVEAGKTGLQMHEVDSLHVPSGGDDTLHTPHVFPFPHMTDEPSHYKSINLSQEHSKQKNKSSNDNILRSGSSDSDEPMQSSELYNGNSSSDSSITIQVPNINTVNQTLDSGLEPADEGSPDKGKGTLSVAGKSVLSFLRMPDGKLLRLVLEKPKPVPNTSAPAPITSQENGLALAKMKLKQALKRNGRILTIERESEVRTSVPTIETTPTSAPSSNRTQQKNGPSYGSGSGEDEDEKKLKFRERNRAAAMRCREKRKTWVHELERRAEEMQKTNQQLQSEVTSLRAEVAQLKTLLLAHKNCPITQAMNQGHISTVPITTLQGSLVQVRHGEKRPHESSLKTMPQKTIMVLKKPTKLRKMHASEPVADVSKVDKTPPKTSASSVSQNNSAWHKPKMESNLTGSDTVPSVPIQSANVSLQSVVVANPVVPQTLAPQPQVLVPFALSSIHPPPLVMFSHSTASATNENNLNLERMMSNQGGFAEGDVEEVPVTETASTTMRINGNESKVIKVNPNAVRFNCNQRLVSEKNKKDTVRSGGDPLSADVEYNDPECSVKRRSNR